MDNFPYGVASQGIPLMGGGMPTTSGKYIFVDASNGSDGNDGLSQDQAFKTVAKAYSIARSNKDDVIVLSTYADHNLTAMVNITKNRVHFCSYDVYGRLYGQRAKVILPVLTTALAANVFAVKNTGIGNTFTGIKFISNNTEAATVAVLGEGGEYASYRNCEFYSPVRLNSDTQAEMVLNGDSTQFFNCTFGSLADAVVGDKVRPAILLTAGTVDAGKVCRDVYFDNCRFWKQAGGTTTAMIKATTAVDVERVMEFHDCHFIANPLGSTPAVAIACAASLTVGIIYLTGDTAAVKCTALATATGIFAALNVKAAATHIALQSTN